MQQKFLRTFAISIVLLGILGTIGNAPANAMYSDALEKEISENHCAQLVCRLNDTGTWHHGELSDEPSYKRYKCSRCAHEHLRIPHHYSELRTPLFTIERSGIQPRIILTHDDDACGPPQLGYGYYHYMCNNPDLTGNLKLIWDKADLLHEERKGHRLSSETQIMWRGGLESLWAAAWILDHSEPDRDGDFLSTPAELTKYSFPEIVYEYNTVCYCCGLTKPCDNNCYGCTLM